jgi:hypothetical protein
MMRPDHINFDHWIFSSPDRLHPRSRIRPSFPAIGTAGTLSQFFARQGCTSGLSAE